MATLLDQARQSGRTVMRNTCFACTRFLSIVGPEPMRERFTQAAGKQDST